MKKVFVIFAVVLSLFLFAACKGLESGDEGESGIAGTMNAGIAAEDQKSTVYNGEYVSEKSGFAYLSLTKNGDYTFVSEAFSSDINDYYSGTYEVKNGQLLMHSGDSDFVFDIEDDGYILVYKSGPENKHLDVGDIFDYRPHAVIRVDGELYYDSYMTAYITCGTADGMITSSVRGAEIPQEDDASNFGTGFEYQRHGDSCVMLVMRDENDAVRTRWLQPRVFVRGEDLGSIEKMPDAVARIEAEVTGIDGDLGEIERGAAATMFTLTPTAVSGREAYRVGDDEFSGISDMIYYDASDDSNTSLKVGDKVMVYFAVRAGARENSVGEIYRITPQK